MTLLHAPCFLDVNLSINFHYWLILYFFKLQKLTLVPLLIILQNLNAFMHKSLKIYTCIFHVKIQQ